MRIVKITKICPNNINKGAVIGGLMLHPPKVGESFCLEGYCTSVVTEIVNNNTFKTLNSTYKIEYGVEVKIYDKPKKQLEDK